MPSPSEVVTSSHSDQVGIWAGTLALAEVGVGSLLHAFHVPLTGTMLSLNQGLFLSRITKLNQYTDHARSLGFEVSSVTALLKSFAPVGKRLTPMLAIASQGLLFTVGVMIFGANLIGVVVGSVLLATWGIIQPAILAGVMISTLTESQVTRIKGGWEKMIAEVNLLSDFTLIHGILILLAIKCFVAAALAVIAWRTPIGKSSGFLANWERLIQRRIHSVPIESYQGLSDQKISLRTNMRLAFRDLRNPIVLASVSLLAVLSYFLDSEFITAIWIALRALAGAYIVYLLLRLLPWDQWLNSENRNTSAIRSAILVIRGGPPAPENKSAKGPDGVKNE